MKRTAYTAISCLSILLLAGRAIAQGSGSEVPHQFVIQLALGQNIQDVCDSHNTTVLASYLPRRLYLLQSSGGDDGNMEADLDGDDRIDSSEQDHVLTTPTGTTQSFFVSALPSDYFDQPTVGIIHLDQAHALASGGGITIAVLDTGVSPHTLLAGRLSPGYNFVDGNTCTLDVGNGLDDNGNGLVDEMVGHGTMVAGLVSLVAPQAQLLPVKVLDSDGGGTTYTVAAGIYFALDNGARVINMSLSSPVGSGTISDAVAAANTAGCVVIAAAGNDNTSQPAYPAACPTVVAVGATSPTDVRAPFSNYGSYLSLSAPGVGVVSTFPGDQYRSASGTSFAAALASGTAALVMSHGVTDPAMVRSRVSSSGPALDLTNPGFAGELGHGRLDAWAAVTQAPCGSADFNGDGDIGTDADIEAFFACLAGACCPTCGSADFNGDGDVGTDADIEAFFRVLAGGHC
jgi:subtilisin family serine protease